MSQIQWLNQVQWTHLPPHDSGAPPALSIAAAALLLVAVTRRGEVVFTRSTSLGSGWDTWAPVVAGGAFRAAPDTPPRLITAGGVVYLLCRGMDDNLHVSRHLGGSWEPWRAVTVEGEVTGTFSAAVTTQGSTRIHIVHSATGPCVDYLVFDASWSAAAPTSRWPQPAIDAQIASDDRCEVALGLRTPDNRMLVYMQTTSNPGWRLVAERHRCLCLSNGVHFANAFHFAYVHDILVDDISGSTRRSLAHSRFRDHEDDDGNYTVVYDYTESVSPQATLTTYRNKLVATFIGDAFAVRAAYWDSADSATPWVSLGTIAGGRTTNPPAVVAFDFAASVTDKLRPNYGEDLFSAVTGATAGGLWAINLSRAFFGNRLADLDLGTDWCMNYTGTRTMTQCDPLPSPTPRVTDLAVYSETGYGSMTYPDWFIRGGVRRTLDHLGWNRPYFTWVHGQVFLHRSAAFYGPELNVNHLSSYLDWFHEMAHRLVSSAGIWNSVNRARPDNPPLLNTLIPAAVIQTANTLFDTDTDPGLTCRGDRDETGRCRGFDGLYGRDEIGGTQHALIYLMQSYLLDGDRLRERLYDDLRAGNDLLLRKYRWIRDYIFRGAEFRRHSEPLIVVSLINKHSGKALDVVNWNLQERAQVQQYAAHGGENQRWALLPDGSGHYHLAAMHSGMCLDVASASKENGAAIQLYTRHQGTNQKWSLVPDGNGYVEIVAAHSNKCLDVVNWGTSDRVRVQQYLRQGADNQKWSLKHVTRV
jgi:hypothetical protein